MRRINLLDIVTGCLVMIDGHLSKNHLAPLRGFRAWLAETGLSSLTCIMQGVRVDFEWLIRAENSPVLKKKKKAKVLFGLKLAEKKNHSLVKRPFLSIISLFYDSGQLKA